jgi:formate-dependent nitrite reductase membrane component NrfD
MLPCATVATMLAPEKESLRRSASAILIWALTISVLYFSSRIWARWRGIPFCPWQEQRERLQQWADTQAWDSLAVTYAVPSGILLGLGIGEVNSGQPIWRAPGLPLLQAVLFGLIYLALTGSLRRHFGRNA